VRCYFMQRGHIAGVELLTATSDDDAIGQATALYDARWQEKGFEGFEVWDRERAIYRYPADSPP
jgi:hypothetical protein